MVGHEPVEATRTGRKRGAHRTSGGACRSATPPLRKDSAVTMIVQGVRAAAAGVGVLPTRCPV